MPEKYTSLADMLNAWGGGILTGLVGALLGSAMRHGSEVLSGKKKLIGWYLMWEVPIIFCIIMIGDAVGDYFDFSPTITAGLIAVMSSIGPRGVMLMIEKWLMKKAG